MSGQRVAALILAGSRPGGDPLARHAGVAHKALIPINGRPMLAHVADALAACPAVGPVAVSIEDASVIADERLLAIPAGPSPSASVRAAIARLGTPLLVTTADHPLLRADWISYFLAHLPDAGAVAALARSDAVMAAAPTTRRTFLRFRGAAYSGCNLFYFRDETALGVVDLWAKVEAHRKHPLRMARLLGVRSVLAYLLGRLTIEEALMRLGQRAGTRLGVVAMPFGESAIDVDDPDDLALVRRMMMTATANGPAGENHGPTGSER